MPRKKTHEEYLLDLKNKNISVIPLEEYRHSDIKIKHKCECGQTFLARPKKVLEGLKCGCKAYKNLTHKDYLQRLQDKGIENVPLEKYKGINHAIKHKCICGNTWTTKPSTILKGHHCGCVAKAFNKNKRKTHEEYLQKLKGKGIKILPLENYKTAKTKILHRCHCGDKFYLEPCFILLGRDCPKHGYEGITKTHEEYLRDLKERGIKVIPLEPYKGAQVKIKHKCVCGNTFKNRPTVILQGILCGCGVSLQEMKINAYLEKMQIEYKAQEWFKELRGKYQQPMRYDFGIRQNGKVIALIEYQGEQHFVFKPHLQKTKDNFIAQQNRDQVKKEYAAKKGIPLIEITYKQKDVIGALENELKALGIGEQKQRSYEQLCLF